MVDSPCVVLADLVRVANRRPCVLGCENVYSLTTFESVCRRSSILDELADAEIHGAPVVLTEGDGLPGLQDPLEECPVLF